MAFFIRKINSHFDEKKRLSQLKKKNENISKSIVKRCNTHKLLSHIVDDQY